MRVSAQLDSSNEETHGSEGETGVVGAEQSKGIQCGQPGDVTPAA